MNLWILAGLCILTILLTAGCAGNLFEISPDAFSQKAMAHSASIGTMYHTITLSFGDHNCDDSPALCCASGYHMCKMNEVLKGGREIETAGSDRQNNPANFAAWVDSLDSSSSTDCSDWTLQSGNGNTASISGSTGTWSIGTQTCGGGDTTPMWCCSP